MSGIRLHHPAYRAAEGSTLTYVVELPVEYPADRPAKLCPSCKKAHLRKSLHLRLDGNGDVVVSKKIYESLKAVPLMAGMEFVNEVIDPPPIRIGAVDIDKQKVIDVPLARDNARAPIIQPGATKYQSEARMWSPFRPIFESMLEKDDRIQTKKLKERRRLFVPTRKVK